MADILDYETLRHFADSWALLALFAIFLGVCLFVFRRGTGETYREAADIPLRDAPLRDAPLRDAPLCDVSAPETRSQP